MASPETLDFQRLLAPISDESPVGPALRADAALRETFFHIRSIRTAARDAERLAVEYSYLSEEDKQAEPAPTPPDWRAVLDQSGDVLSEKSKDLWIAAWMIEALVRVHGFGGLRDGFRLVRQLCERYWDEIHPRPDEEEGEDITDTLSLLSSLNDVLIAPLEQIPITAETRSMPALSSADHKDASQGTGPAEITLELFDSAVRDVVREGGPDFFQDLVNDIEGAADEFARLDQLWEERCGQDEDGMSRAPATSNLKRVITECRDRVRSLAKDVLDGDADAEADGPTENGGPEGVAADGSASGGPSVADVTVRTRQDAFRALVKVADFFKRTEPHSPISYKLEEAVRWGQLALPELMDELIRDLVTDDSIRQEMFRRAGIAPAASDQSD